MARMPGAIWLGENSPRNPMVKYDIVCVHTIVGFAPAHAAHFSVKADGTIQQSRDTRYQSAANLHGNPRVIAIENEDHGAAFGNWGGTAVPRLTDEQVEANGRILAWAHKTHGIPLQLCPDSKPGSRGLAYHRQGIDGNFGGFRFPGRVAGGEVWTEHFGKVCPGDNRIAQLPDILAIARDITEMDWFDMASKQEVTELLRSEVTAPLRERMNEIAVAERNRDKKRFEPVDAEIEALAVDIAELSEGNEVLARRLQRLRDDVALLAPPDPDQP